MSLPFVLPSPWKLATILTGVVSLVLTSLLLASYFENRNLTRQSAQMSETINNPKTGYIARLAQANTNVAQLRTSVEVQNRAYRELQSVSAARLAATERRLALAQAETRRMERNLAEFLATAPQGTTFEERVRDIDERILEELGQ